MQCSIFCPLLLITFHHCYDFIIVIVMRYLKLLLWWQVIGKGHIAIFMNKSAKNMMTLYPSKFKMLTTTSNYFTISKYLMFLTIFIFIILQHIYITIFINNWILGASFKFLFKLPISKLCEILKVLDNGADCFMFMFRKWYKIVIYEFILF